MTVSVKRLPDWRNRLDAYLDEKTREPFEYGTNDCALFVAGAVNAMTGFDPAEGFRGRYHTSAQAQRSLLSHGYEKVTEMARQFFREIHPSRAQIGDLAVAEDALGVIGGPMIFVLREDGLGQVPLSLATSAFEV